MMDVAAKAGVSQATVSLVMNENRGVRLSDATRQRVFEAARALGYELARRVPRQSLVERGVIYFVVDEISTDPWMALAFDGMREKAWEFGVSVHLVVTRGDGDAETQMLDLICQQPILGLIYGTILTRGLKPSHHLFDHPSVLLNCYDEQRRLPSVLPGDLLGGLTATERLIQAGHRRIGLISGQTGVEGASERLRGYRQALASKDIPFDPALVYPGNWQPDSGYAGTRALMALADPPTAIFCANDLMALGCYDALKEMALAIPQDVAVIGFDDREIAQYTRPPLTTLILPHFEMGACAAEILFEHSARRATRPAQLKVECALVERASVGPVTQDLAL
jgi:LacI family transcriptional regulator